MIRCSILLAGMLALVGVGCGKQPPPVVPVEGRVTLDGQPLPRAEVTFYPMTEFGGEYMASGETDDQGRFKLVTMLRSAGACACENRVTVTEASPPEELRGISPEIQTRLARMRASLKNRPIPVKYSNLAQSPLKVQVTPGKTEYLLELTR